MSAWTRTAREAFRSRDVQLFSAAVGVVAAHTLADTVVAPEPGTAARDHLVPAVATLGLLVLAVAVYVRARPGLRAAVSIGLGILALEGFAIATADAATGRPRGDNWTGFLLLPAGLTLCGLGIVLLWRSRKRSGRRFLRRASLCVVAVLGAYFVLAPVAVAILATHRPREAATPVDLGRPARAVTIETTDSLRLRGQYVRSRNGAAVIVYPASASRAPQARMLVRHGYGVLMLPMRGYATSDGDPNMFGWGATADIDAAVAFLARQPDVRRGVGGIGFSVGGEQMLEAAAANRDLRAVVSDGAGERSIRESILRGPAGWLALPTAAVETAAVASLSGHLPPPSLPHLIGQIAPRPVYLVYAGHGSGGEDLQPRYFEAAAPPSLLWKVPEAHHTGAYAARPGEYERRVTWFLDRALLGQAGSGQR